MSQCKVIRRPRRTVCVGDLDTPIEVQTRRLSGGMSAAAETTFATVASPWALVTTVRGVVVVDEANVDRNVTHQFVVRAPEVAGVDSRYWVKLDGQRYDILDVEDYDERGEFVAILCALTGSDTRAAADA